MSDTIKLIVEIPKSALELLKTTGVDWLGAEHILSAVAQGTPLSKVLSDLKVEIDYENSYDEPAALACEDGYDRFHYGVKSCLDIIDKHINEMEGQK